VSLFWKVDEVHRYQENFHKVLYVLPLLYNFSLDALSLSV